MSKIRTKLREIYDEKHKFTAIFDGFGKKRNWKHGFIEKTCLFTEIKGENDEILTDHLWFNYTKKFQELKLREGDLIEFYGIVRTYAKGYYKDTIDYKISYPSKVKLLKRKMVDHSLLTKQIKLTKFM